jgi:hypothetical protein
MPIILAPPEKQPLMDAKGAPLPLFFTNSFRQWLLSVTNRLSAAPYVLSRVELEDQDAAIVATDLISSPTAGLYRVSWRLRVMQAASTSSSVQLTITTTDGGVTCAEASAALTTNTTNTPLQGPPMVVKSDAGAPITYETAYASVGGVDMLYGLDITVELL